MGEGPVHHPGRVSLVQPDPVSGLQVPLLFAPDGSGEGRSTATAATGSAPDDWPAGIAWPPIGGAVPAPDEPPPMADPSDISPTELATDCAAPVP